MFGKIRTQLTGAFVGLALFPILFLGAFIAQKTYTAAKNNALSVTHDSALRVAGDVKDFIRGMVDHIEVVTRVHGLQGLGHDELQDLLHELLAFQNAYDEITLLDGQGRERAKVSRTKMVSAAELGSRRDQKEFQVPLQSQKIYFGPVRFRDNTGEPHMICSVPFFDLQTGTIAGMVVADLRLKRIWNLLAGLTYRPGEQVYITNQEGLIIAHRNPSVVLRGTLVHPAIHDNPTSMRQHREFMTSQTIIGDHHIFLGDQQLHVISEWQKRHALALAYRMLTLIALGSAAALAAAVFLVIPVVGNIIRPLQELATTAQRIEEGDLHQRAEVRGTDEISDLARAFNQMTGQLRSSMTSLKAEVAERATIQQALQRELLINESLASVSKVMLATEDIREVADEVLSRALMLTGSEHGYVGYIEQHTGTMVSPTMTAMMGKECRVEGTDNKIEFPPNDDGTYGHLWGVALNTKAPFICNDPASHPAAIGCPAGHVEINRFLSVPVLFNDRLIGQIALANGPVDYQLKDADGLKRLGRLYALALNRVRSQEENNRLLSDLRQSQKMEAIGTLAGGIAHDFNNMLTPILGYSELALTRLEPDDGLYEHLQAIHQAADRAKELIKQILTFSRQREHELTAITVQPILRETIKLLRSSLPTTIDIREHIDSTCGTILSDLTQLQQVIMNLCTNAYHAMGDGGGVLDISLQEIHLSAADPLVTQGLQAGPVARLTISDSGCGMDKATLERIFEPYFTTKDQGKGTGMGLAMVHAIITNHQGLINVDSEPGKGTRFTIYFPIIHEPAAEPAQKQGQVATGGSERILLVDDEEPIALMLRDMLRHLDYQVTAITSSPEALRVFRDHPDQYDLVITDQTMPELTGGELAREMLAIRPDIPIILCTGFSESFTEEMAHQIGIRQYIMKPVIVQELAQKIRALLPSEK